MLHNLQKKFNKCFSAVKDCPAHWIILSVLFLGILFKNLLLQTFISGSNSFKPQFDIAPSMLLWGCFFNLITTLLLLCPTFLFKKNGAKIGYGFTVSVLMTLLLLVDCYYFRGFSEIPSISILSALSGDSAGAGTTAIADSISGLVSPYDLLYLLDYALLALFGLFHALYKKPLHIKSRLLQKKKSLSFFFDHTPRYRLLRFASYGAFCLAVLLFLPAMHVLRAVEAALYYVLVIALYLPFVIKALRDLKRGQDVYRGVFMEEAVAQAAVRALPPAGGSTASVPVPPMAYDPGQAAPAYQGIIEPVAVPSWEMVPGNVAASDDVPCDTAAQGTAPQEGTDAPVWPQPSPQAGASPSSLTQRRGGPPAPTGL
jgi:hypothetical protein